MIKEETIAHHSANVAMIATVLAGEIRPAMLMYALTHDVGEVYTGDVPYPFKKQHPALKAYLDNAEELYKINNGLNFPCDLEDYEIVKAADMLDLVLKCVDEMQMGNQTVIPMLNTGMRVLREVHLPCAAQARLDHILGEIENGFGE